MYNCIFDSRKPEAVGFRKWVTSEVLPSIRKTGAYSVKAALPGTYLEALKELVVVTEAYQALTHQATIDAPYTAIGYAYGNAGHNAMILREWISLMTPESGHIKEREVHAFLIEEKYLYRAASGNRLRAYAQFKHLFKLGGSAEGHCSTALRVTGEGRKLLGPIIAKRFQLLDIGDLF